MAEIGCSRLRKAGTLMSKVRQLNQLPARAWEAPVRVKLERINCDVGKLLPEEGSHQEWVARLQAALGTASIEFVDATLYQLQAAARLPNSGVSEIAVNAALAVIESEQPRGETDCAIVVQMACVHLARMTFLGRLGGGHGGDRHVLATATALSPLSRTVLARKRSGMRQ